MLKKLALVVLLGISNLHAVETESPAKTSFIQKIKNSSTAAKLMVIIPCIITFISMSPIIKACKDNPEKINIAHIANTIRWIAFGIGAYLSDLLVKINFGYLSCKKCRDVNKSSPLLAQR